MVYIKMIRREIHSGKLYEVGTVHCLHRAAANAFVRRKAAVYSDKTGNGLRSQNELHTPKASYASKPAPKKKETPALATVKDIRKANKDSLLAYLAAHEVDSSRTMTVAKLRKLAEEHLASSKASAEGDAE